MTSNPQSSPPRKDRPWHIHCLPDDRSIEVSAEQTILDASLAAGIPHTHVCGGRARCSTCRVMVLEGLEHCSPRNAAEERLTRHLGLDCSIRLACQTRISGDIRMRRLVLDCEDETLAQDAVRDVSRSSTGEEKTLAILFADIVGFTTFAESFPPYDIIHTLNRYYHLAGRVVRHHNGSINSYAGDGFMALFGLENPEGIAEAAVRAGLGILEVADKLNDYVAPLYDWKFSVRIGVHCGEAVVGALGAKDNQHFTVIGDAVNFASRIEAANKQSGTNFLVSEQVAAQTGHIFNLRPLSARKIAGKSGVHKLFEVMMRHP